MTGKNGDPDVVTLSSDEEENNANVSGREPTTYTSENISMSITNEKPLDLGAFLQSKVFFLLVYILQYKI